MNKFKKIEKGTGSPALVMLGTVILIALVIGVFMLEKTFIMTHQREIDDALMDAVTASMIADESESIKTIDDNENMQAVYFRGYDWSFNTYRNCMNLSAIGNTDFYKNFKLTSYIIYEVHEDGTITIADYENEVRMTYTGTVGNVYTPTGKQVTISSVYAKVNFDIHNFIPNAEDYHKAREIYCTFEIENLTF